MTDPARHRTIARRLRRQRARNPPGIPWPEMQRMRREYRRHMVRRVIAGVVAVVALSLAAALALAV